MQTQVDEIAAGIFRLSTFLPDAAPGGLSFNQFLVTGEEPLLFHTGPRAMFASVSEAVSRSDIIGPAVDAEAMFGYTSSPSRLASTARRLAELAPKTLACMHGSTFSGDGAATLRDLANAYDERFVSASG